MCVVVFVVVVFAFFVCLFLIFVVVVVVCVCVCGGGHIAPTSFFRECVMRNQHETLQHHFSLYVQCRELFSDSAVQCRNHFGSAFVSGVASVSSD